MGKFIPRDAVVYGWLTLNPGDGQWDQMVEIWECFEEFSAFADGIDEILEESEDDFGTNLEDDVWHWIGPDLSFAAIGLKDWEEPDTVAIMGVREHREHKEPCHVLCNGSSPSAVLKPIRWTGMASIP